MTEEDIRGWLSKIGILIAAAIAIAWLSTVLLPAKAQDYDFNKAYNYSDRNDMARNIMEREYRFRHFTYRCREEGDCQPPRDW